MAEQIADVNADKNSLIDEAVYSWGEGRAYQERVFLTNIIGPNESFCSCLGSMLAYFLDSLLVIFLQSHYITINFKI